MSDEVLGALGEAVLRCQALEVEMRRQRRALRRLAFYMWLEFACILFLSIGMGILARTIG